MQLHIQTTPYTTAASALLTILHHLKPEIPLTREEEFNIWKKTAALPTRASSIFALALHAKECGIYSEVIVEKKEYDFPDYRFYRYTKEDIEIAAFTVKMFLQKAEQSGIPIIKRAIQFTEIKELLDEKRILLIRLNCKPLRNIKRNSSNFVIITGRRDQKYEILDPYQGTLLIEESLLWEAFESLESKKHRDHRMIIF